MLNTCRIVHVTQYLVRKSLLQTAAALVEETELHGREIIEILAVATHEVREHRARNHGILVLQNIYQPVHILTRIEAQTVHARVEFDVHGIVGDTLLPGGLDERVQQAEGIHLRLQVVVEHGLEGRHFGIHNHDVLRDTVAAQRHTLVGYRHGQIVHAMILQGLGHLHGTGSIAVGLHHTHNLSFGAQERAVVVQVIHQCVEVHLQDGLVHLLHHQFRQSVKTELTGTFQQDNLVAELREDVARHKLLTTVEE